MDFLELAARRYSCRNYTDEPVADADLERILQAAHLAPSACNLQPFHLYVARGEALSRMQGVGRLHGAPLAIIVCTDENSGWRRRHDGTSFVLVDAAIIADHMILEATALGLGTCWIGAFKPQLTKEVLAIPDPWYPQLIVLAGHANEEWGDPKRHETARAPLADKVTWL